MAISKPLSDLYTSASKKDVSVHPAIKATVPPRPPVTPWRW